MIDLSEIECRMYQNVSEWSRAESSATVAPDLTMRGATKYGVMQHSMIDLREIEWSRMYRIVGRSTIT